MRKAKPSSIKSKKKLGRPPGKKTGAKKGSKAVIAARATAKRATSTRRKAAHAA